VFTKPENKKGSCSNISVEFYAPPTDKGGCNNISVVFEKIAIDDIVPICDNTLFWDIQSSTGFDLIISGSGSVVLDGVEESMDINKPIADGVEIAFCDSANVTRFSAIYGNIDGDMPILPLSIEIFDVRGNNLNGNIPILQSSFRAFLASGNNLSGNIPSLPSSLRILNAGRNNLSGNIPTLSSSLYYFSVENNNLSGFNGGNLSSISNFNIKKCNVSTADIDSYLQEIANNSVIDGSFLSAGSNMGIPTNTTAIDTLRARGWYVSVEGGY